MNFEITLPISFVNKYGILCNQCFSGMLRKSLANLQECQRTEIYDFH